MGNPALRLFRHGPSIKSIDHDYFFYRLLEFLYKDSFIGFSGIYFQAIFFWGIFFPLTLFLFVGEWRELVDEDSCGVPVGIPLEILMPFLSNFTFFFSVYQRIISKRLFSKFHSVWLFHLPKESFKRICSVSVLNERVIWKINK